MALQSHPDDFRSVMASVDSQGRRRWVYAHIVGGVWRRRRALLAVVLIGFFLALPYVTVGGRPLLLIDIPSRQFTIAGRIFWPQDFIYLLLFMLIAIVATALTVALVGRFFCGWLCPHNVFLEMVYRPLERLLEGTAVKRRRRDQEGGAAHLARKLTKWLAFLAVTVVLANTMTALFVGSGAFRYGLVLDVAAHPDAAIFWAFFAGAVLFNFAWFREQTCTIVCPYGRLQAALLDSHSLGVAYDPGRGEPRGKLRGAARAVSRSAIGAAAPQLAAVFTPPVDVAPASDGTAHQPIALGAATATATLGDCVDCGLCVTVCPTGIDIRNGSQLECIHCAACIDACDEVMVRVGRPKGLIAYRSEDQLAGRPHRVWRPRILIYALILMALIAATAIGIAGRADLEVVVLRPAVLPSLESGADGSPVVRQMLSLALVNHTAADLDLAVSLPGEPGAHVYMAGERVAVAANAHVEFAPFVDLPKARFAGGDLQTVLVLTDAAGHRFETPVHLRAP
jgi:polyferredoxin